MIRASRAGLALNHLVVALLLASASTVYGQEPDGEGAIVSTRAPSPPRPGVEPAALSFTAYAHPVQGVSSLDMVRRALDSNRELAAVRLDVERARAQLRQAGLRPNPTLDFEHTSGRIVGSPGERETAIGFALPLEVGGQRGRRVALAEAELASVEAEVADRERRLRADVLATYADALAALRELETTERFTELDQATARIVRARVDEGEAAPLESRLLEVEIARLRSRRAVVEGRLQLALIRLRTMAGLDQAAPLTLRDELAVPLFGEPPASLDEAIDRALMTRPDLRFARLGERAADAGLDLARAEGRLSVTAFGRFSVERSTFDGTPVGVLSDRDRKLAFGVSIGLPVFNRNQGAVADREAGVEQARRRREFAEAAVRAEVTAAFTRYQAATRALAIYENDVLPQSNINVRNLNEAYRLGAYSLTEVLVEQRRLVDAQRELTEMLSDAYRALADLQAAIGGPDPAPSTEDKGLKP
jgi:cobalt-zinc-cadmium efflux system outer membrane protein